MSKVIEVLFPEVANLYGDLANARYLLESIKDSEKIEDHFDEEPYFVKNTPSVIFMGAVTEKSQELAIEKLRPYKNRIEELIEAGVVFLFTGNAMEIFWEYIENDDGSRIDGLGLFKLHADRRMFKRHNHPYMGEFEGMTLVGHKCQFTYTYGDVEEGFISTTHGEGMNPEENCEGVHRRNFFGTYLLGPFLIFNPQFTAYILKMLDVDAEPAFMEAAMDAYNERVKEWETESFAAM